MKFKKKIIQLCTVLFLMGYVSSTQLCAAKVEYKEEASDIIINSLQAQPKKSFLRRLYTQLFFVPIWMNEGNVSIRAKDLFAKIKNDDTLNVKGKLYNNTLALESTVRTLYAEGGTLTQKVELEFKISQLYYAYTNYAYFGSINWGAFQARISNLMVNDVNTEWELNRPNADPIMMLEDAVLGGSLSKQLENAVPTQYRYKALQKKLVKYRAIQANGGWPKIELLGKLKPYKKLRQIVGVGSLRERLRATEDYVSCENSLEDNTYDKCLQKAVKIFQKRNGMKADGVVGSRTLRLLNTTVNKRIEIILLNLDRIKWLPKHTSRLHIVMNIPDFMLYFEENGTLIQEMRTVVGKPKNPTPIFSNKVKTIVLNPYWNLPKSIIQKEMIPKLLRNPNAMAKRGIEIRSGWGEDAEKVNPRSIDWVEYLYSEHMPFRFAQLPGPRNALGKVKFLFPNKYAVYMHDTPAKKLFNRNKRAFSHGCIRLHKPRKLLETFSKFNKNINFKESQETLKGKDRVDITLEEKVPIDVIYLTAWVDYDGKLQFRDDIYGYDKMQLKSFRKW
ncbi:MAG: L,D-transpeptidase family protein [Sulfurovum sp.]|nr:L,D-transpeptidase family protein [Sulfurovum sp.]